MTPKPEDLKDSPEMRQAVLDGIAAGRSMRSVCKDLDINYATPWRWVEKDDVFRQQYADARLRQAQVWADEITDIADDGSEDLLPDGSGNHARVARHRLMTDTRKWMLSKVLPKVYGDKLQVEHSGSVTIQVDPLAQLPAPALMTRLQELDGAGLLALPDPDIIDVEPISISGEADKTPQIASGETDLDGLGENEQESAQSDGGGNSE